MRYLTPIPKQFVDQSGIPYSDGTVSVYLSGSDELADIFEDAEGDALCPNPCRLDSNGAWQCFVPGDVPLDYIVQDKHGNVVFPYYNILPGSGGSGAVFTVKGTNGEIKVTNRVTASGRLEATVGLDSAFKQRIEQVEGDIGDLNEEMQGVEGSIRELNEDLDHLDDRVETAEDQIGQLSESLSNKKDKQTPVVFSSIPADKTVKRIYQDANGTIDVETQDIQLPDYLQRFEDIENEQSDDAKVIAAALNDLNARLDALESDDENIGDKVADKLDAQVLMEGGIRVKVKQASKSLNGDTNKTITNISQDENGGIAVTFSAIAFPDWTSAITAATDLCEKLANKKTSVTGNEGSNTYYPTTKALVDYLDSRLQNLGGKKITNNGVPFTAASQLPTTTPYYGQNINSNDYAFVQDTGLASRYTATVTGSSVAWTLDYEIALPVFTAEQQDAIDSGVNSTKVGNYDSHLANTSNPHGVTYSQVGASPDTHTHQVMINGETKTIDKTGGTPVDLGTYLTTHQSLDNYLTKNGDGSDVTASFTEAGSRNNISTGDKLSVLFGKIKKWFSDLKTIAFTGNYSDLSGTPTLGSLASKDSIGNNDISGTISDAHIASASTWNAKQNAIADLSDIREGASKGETAVQPEDLATYMTNPVEGRVIAAALNDLNARLNALEYEDDNIGDKIADKFDSQILRCCGVDVKTKQAAKASPSASGTTLAFIDSVSQDSNGEITATKKSIQSASVSQPGVVQLDSTVVSTSTTKAATPSAVKAAYDLANSKKDKQTAASYLGSATKTITGLSQNANGEITPTFSDIDFDSKVLPFYPQALAYMTPDERAALNAKMQEVAYNGGIIILWDGRGSNLPCVLYFYNSDEYYFYRIEKDGNEIEYYNTIVTYDGDTKTFNVDLSVTTIDPTLYEKLANKKTTITGNESSTTYYPNIKAVVDYINGVIQNLGGKLITDYGDPFTSSANLPTTTPFHGINIADKDYAYIQGVGIAERWSATVNGSAVTWQQEYAISIPVFTPSQQAVIDGDSSDMTVTFTQASNRDTAANDFVSESTLGYLFGKIKKWFADIKTVAFSGSYTDLTNKPSIPAAANNGVLTITQNGTSKGTFSANQSSNGTIELTDTTKVEIDNNTTGSLLFTTRNTSGEITPYTGNNLSVDTTKGFTGVMAGTVGANATLGFNIDVSGFNNHIIPASSGDSIRDFFSKVKKLQVDMDASLLNYVPINCPIDGNLSESCFYLYIYRGIVDEGVPVRLTIGELWKVIKNFIGSTSANGLGLDKDYYQGTAYNAIYDDVGNQIRATYATRDALRNKSTSAYNEVNVTTPDANAYLYFEDIDMAVRLEIKNVSSNYYYGLVMKRNVKSESIQVSGSAMLSSQASGQPSPNTEIKRIWTSVNNVSWSNFGHFGILQANASVDYAATGKIQFKCGSFMVNVDVSITKAGADSSAYVFMTGYTSPCVAGHNTIPVV